jgi:hypothetical protein
VVRFTADYLVEGKNDGQAMDSQVRTVSTTTLHTCVGATSPCGCDAAQDGIARARQPPKMVLLYLEEPPPLL